MDVLDSPVEARLKFKYYLNPLGAITICCISLALLAIVFRIFAIFMVQKIHPINSGTYTGTEHLEWWGNSIDMAIYVYLAFFVLSCVPFFMWLYRAYFNLDHIKLRGLNVTPGWAVGWFFIPFANLYYIPVVINDLMKGTKHRELEEPIGNSIEYQNVPPWGAIWIIVRILGTIMSYMGLYRLLQTMDMSKLNTYITYEYIFMALMLISGLIILYIVISVTKRQNKIFKGL